MCGTGATLGVTVQALEGTPYCTICLKHVYCIASVPGASGHAISYKRVLRVAPDRVYFTRGHSEKIIVLVFICWTKVCICDTPRNNITVRNLTYLEDGAGWPVEAQAIIDAAGARFDRRGGGRGEGGIVP